MLSHVKRSYGYVITLMIVSLMMLSPIAEAQSSLHNQIKELIRGAGIGNAKVAVEIHDFSTQESLVEINTNTPMIPASNMKLITTAVALETLGPKFVFKTRLLERHDELIIEGNGDPSFGDPVLLKQIDMDVDQMMKAWVNVVKNRGQKQYKRVLVDDRIFDQNFVHPDWPDDQLDKWYCAQVAGLNFNDNCLDIFAIPTRSGQAPRVSTRPVITGLKFSNLALTGDKNAFWASRKKDSNDITFRGVIKHRLVQPIHLTINDPSLFFAKAFQTGLTEEGISVEAEEPARIGDLEAVRPTRVLAIVETPISTVITRCNKDSQNLFAEALIKRVGQYQTGQPGSWANGAATVRTWLTKNVKTLAGDIHISDGSGMSRNNQVSARLLTAVLKTMYEDDKLNDIYVNSLAVPGEEGTLQQRLTNDGITAKIYAKSGYLRHTISLSGYLIYPDRAVSFSVMLNDYKRPVYLGKKLIDDILIQTDRHFVKRVLPKETLGG